MCIGMKIRFLFNFISITKSLFLFHLQDEYKDENQDNNDKTISETQPGNTNSEISPNDDKIDTTNSVKLIDTSFAEYENIVESSDVPSDLVGLRMDCGDMPANFGSFMPSQLLQVRNNYDTFTI